MNKEPTTDERLKFYRDNAEAFVATMSTMVEMAEREGNDDLAVKLKVWALMPWQAALRDDKSGELWPTCEVCGEPMKIDTEIVAGEDCSYHRNCIS